MIRRRLWTTTAFAFSVFGVGLLVLIVVYLALGLSFGSSVADALVTTAEFYGIWFWAPFAMGLALGGIRRRPTAAAI